LIIQSLTTLSLGLNRIGPQGAQHLANALEQNKVMFYFFINFLTLLHHYYFTQTLTTLNLQYNKIGEQGTKDLANALQQNKVRKIHCIFSVLQSFNVSPRH
jgi:penicillin-binding protein-related factor A (putative recombinase)